MNARQELRRGFNPAPLAEKRRSSDLANRRRAVMGASDYGSEMK